MRKLPLLITISVVVGILAGHFLRLNILTALIPAVLALLIYLFLYLKGRTPHGALTVAKYHVIWVMLLFVSLGALTEFYHRPETAIREYSDKAIAYGEVRDVVYGGESDRLSILIDSIIDPAKGVSDRYYNYEKRIYTDGTILVPGNLITFPVAPSGDAVTLEASLPYLLQCISVDSEDITKLGYKKSLRSIAWLCRREIEIVIDKSHLSPATSAFANALLLGDRGDLEGDTQRMFADAGVSHMLAVSGMHVAVVAGIILTLLLPLNLTRHRKLRFILAIPLVWLFVWLTGVSPSAVRAAVMTSFMMVALIAERHSVPLESLLWAIFFILLFTPDALFNIGFQLSVTCVGALILFANSLNTVDQHHHRQLYKLNALFVTSFVATAASWALTSYAFGRLPVMFFPANILALPALPFYMSLLILDVILSAIGLEWVWLSRFLSSIYDGFCSLLLWIAGEGASTIDIQVGVVTVILWTLALVIAGVVIHRFRGKMGAMIAAGAFVVALISVPLAAHAEEEPEYALEIKNSYPHIEITEYIEGEKHTTEMPYRCISKLNYGEATSKSLPNNATTSQSRKHILIVDALPSKRDTTYSPDVVVLGRGFQSDLRCLMRYYPKLEEKKTSLLIVTHPGLRRKREAWLLRQTDTIGIRSHSLRLHGPLMIHD